MRTAFIETLCQLAAEDSRIWLLTGDLGYSVLERFAERFPERFVNVGVAEQNMTGVAAGLALCDKVVFTYSIANFSTLRCLEQIRNDVCYHNLSVKVVAIGGGLAYGPQGYTHYGVEDLAVMRALPNMAVVAPGDPMETRLATRVVAQHPGPCYLRLGKAHESFVHLQEPEFVFGKAITVRRGGDATLVTTGGTLKLAVEAADALAREGVAVHVMSIPFLSPLDVDALQAAAGCTRLICVLEEHGSVGGLSDAVARSLVGHTPCRLHFVTVDTPWLLQSRRIGSQAYLAKRLGFTVDAITRQVLEWLSEPQGP
ncbi:MAG: transketolase [Planctomycetota bacterium]|nr:transketolase [Planctomycetota bacterium]